MRRWIVFLVTLSAVFLLRSSVFAQESAFVVVEEFSSNPGWIEGMSVSADGRFIVYDLAPISSGDKKKIFLYDRATDTQTNLTSQIPAYDKANTPFISSDGRYVTFTAHEHWSEVNREVYGYLFDRKVGTYRNILTGANGQPLRGYWGGGALITDMSSDGRHIVYIASAYNPFDGKNVNCIDDFDNTVYPCYQAFLYDRMTGSTERISVNSKEELANRDTYGTRVSDDGRYVLFESGASNLDGGNILCGDNFYCIQLHLRDRKTGITRLLTKTPDGKPSKGIGIWPFFMNLSKDGKYASYVDELPDVNTGGIFLQNTTTDEREIISISSHGTLPRKGGVDTGDISPDNRYALFTSYDIQAMTDDPNTCNPTVPPHYSCPAGIFLRDRVAKTTTLINSETSLVISFYVSNIVGDANQIILPGNGTIEVWAAANATLPQPSNLKAKRISNTQIDLTWTDNTSGVAAYHVERSLDGLTKWQEVGVTAVGVTSFSDKTVVCGARYHYRISAADTVARTVSINSFYDDANIPACTLPPISLKSPANGANIDTSTPTFTWEPVNGVKQYRLVVTASDGDKPVDQVFKAEAIAEICDAELCSFDLSANGLALPDDDYTWKVKAKVISGLKTESGVRTLEVDAFGAPTLLTPADGATDVAPLPVFTWQETGIGSSYKVVVKQVDVEVFDHTVTAANCVEAVCTLDTAGLLTLEASQTYVWRVIAKNNGDKEKSAKWSFTTGSESGLLPLQANGN